MPLFDISPMESSPSPPTTEISYSTPEPEQKKETATPSPLFAIPATASAPAPLFALPTNNISTNNNASMTASSPNNNNKNNKSKSKDGLFDHNVKSPLFSGKTSGSSAASIQNSVKALQDMERGTCTSLSRQDSALTRESKGSHTCRLPGKRSCSMIDDSTSLPDLLRKDHDHSYHSDDAASNSSSASSLMEQLRNRSGSIVFLIVILGMVASALFLAIGISGAQREQHDQFERTAKDLVTAIESQFDRYVTAANYVHHYCRNRSFTRQGFKSMYEYLIEDGLDFKAVQFDPNVTREERAEYEEEARAYYAEHYPHIEYQGFKGFDNGVSNGLVPTAERDFYFPIHYMEPVIGNEAAIDLDYYSHISRRRTLTHAFDFGEPAITDRLLLVKSPGAVSRCGSQDAASYGVVLMHPGVNISDPSVEIWPRDLSSIVICIPGLLLRSSQDVSVPMEFYVHDSADSSGEVKFLGGIAMESDNELTYIDETELEDVNGHLYYQDDLDLTNKIWTVTVVATNETYKPNLTFVILGGVLVMLASVCLGLWVHTNTKRTHKFNAMKAKVEGEKAALILENTRQAARAERELNDFIAHEVRNPVAAAMAACSFVRAAVNETEPLVDPQKREDTREDVSVIYNSLQFINDLLRNMLDMHRASHKQLQVNFETIDLYHDILQSTAGMIYQRDSKVKIIVECEPLNLHVKSDCLRLKQVILNLSRNATKFVNTGFIKLKGSVVNGHVRIAVQDSGIGIPAEKRDLLFAKFQESLDQLSQGTGIGLYLCKNLVELLGGEIFLEKDYDSGVPGNPGTSIIIDLKRPPVTEDEIANGMDGDDSRTAAMTSSSQPTANGNSNGSDDQSLWTDKELPEHLSVLFVDDDAILRKLFARSVKRVAPGWSMREASNGESALQLLDQGLKFDLIFVDQYMASIEKQLLGTETILEMRALGFEGRLFGLSANDLEAEFIAAGADGFVIKPFPTETDALKNELLRAYFGKRAYYAPP